MTFIQPPFWAVPRRRRSWTHPASSVLVSPVATIATSAVANPTVITTETAHGLWSGDTVAIAGHVGATPALDGSHVVTVLSPLSFTVPVNVSVAGTGGTVTPTTLVEPLTLTEAKLRAGLAWADGDPRDALMRNFLSAARHKVETDTGLAIRLQVRDVYADVIDADDLAWPSQSVPLQAVSSITWTDAAGVVTVVDDATYQVDLASGRIALTPSGVWPTGDFRSLSPWVLRIVAGYPTVAAIPAPLVHAIGLMTAHYATVARDVTVVGSGATIVPFGYDDAIQPYRREVLA